MTRPKLMRELPIQEWVEGLARIPQAKFTAGTVERYIEEQGILPDTLRPYSYFPTGHYGRNLIFKNEVFECLALTWDIGQFTAIHDHNEKSGWISVVAGQLFVQNYRLEDRDPVRHTCRVIPTGSAELGRSHTASVDRERGLHRVSNLARYAQRAISVHVYEQPMESCAIYDPEKGTYELVDLSYTSEYGRLNPELRLSGPTLLGP